MGSKIPTNWSAAEIISAQLPAVLISVGGTVLGVVLFFFASKRRKNFDNGLLNALAMIVSMLIFAFMAVFSFFSLKVFLSK